MSDLDYALRFANWLRHDYGMSSLAALPCGDRRLFRCPLALALIEPGRVLSDWEINGPRIGFGWTAENILTGDRIRLPYPVARFARDFYRGKYPELVASPKPEKRRLFSVPLAGGGGEKAQ